MNAIRTPKAGEHWVWLPCEKHRFKQLRDLVVEGRDFEEQPELAQYEIMEHVRCGCRFPADNPTRALADLRAHEALEAAEWKAKAAAIERREPPVDPIWLVLGIFVAMAVLIYLVAFRRP